MYDQMEYIEFLEKEVRTWDPLNLSAGEVIRWWSELIPSVDDLALELVEGQYLGSIE